jgi:hypothetical protein
MDPEAIRLAPHAAIAATVGFFILAFLLLYPIWRFLNREEEVSRHWTPEEIARAEREAAHRGDGAESESEEPAPPAGAA